MEKDGVYFGVDLNDAYTMISFFQQNMEEPQTISTVMGSENYQIPTFLSKKRGMGQWFFGEEARRHVQFGDAEGVDGLFEKALGGEEVFLDHERYQARDLMAIYLKKVLGLSGRLFSSLPTAKIAVSMEKVSMEAMEMLTGVIQKIGIDAGSVMLLDRRESFYYFVFNQKPELFLHDVVLFDYFDSDLMSCVMRRNMQTTPQMITMDHGNQGKLLDHKDLQFEEIARRVTDGSVVSSVYLVGDGFDGHWMKSSLQFLCQKGKVFVGKNLYSKGACYAGLIRDRKKDWPFVYIGTNELKLNLYVKVLIRNEMQFFTLITAGESWYESKGECEVILDGTPEIEFWIQQPESREAHVELLELTDLPARPRRTTRLRITATPVSDREIRVVIKDLGFGEIVPASNKTWEHTMALE